LINYGASVCWPFERFRALDKYKAGVNELEQKTIKGESKIETLFNIIGPSYAAILTTEEMNKTLANINHLWQKAALVSVYLSVTFQKQNR
jgi:dihydroorotase